MRDLRWVAGLVCVVGLVSAVGGLLWYGLWDLFRQYKGEALSVTASVWWLEFFQRHPIAAFCAGVAVGVMAGHLMWPQRVRG